MHDGCWETEESSAKGDRMKRVRKEACQARETFIWGNIIKLSSDNDIPVTIKLDDEEITGIAWRILSTRHSDMLYLKNVDSGSDDIEKHVCVNIQHVKTIVIEAEPGMLDDIWNIA